MGKTKTFGVALIVSLIMVVSSCKKKDDPRQMVYNTWSIEQTEMDGDEVGQEAARKTITLEFTEKGEMKLIDGSVELNGTFTVNETATTMETVMDGSTDSFVISDLTASTMTLTTGDERMVLKVKQ